MARLTPEQRYRLALYYVRLFQQQIFRAGCVGTNGPMPIALDRFFGAERALAWRMLAGMERDVRDC